MGARDITIRLATSADGPAIGALQESNGFAFEDFGFDWTDIGANWLVAEHEDDIIGAIQVLPAKPFGRLESFVVDPTIGKKMRAVVVRDLGFAGYATLQQAGCQASLSTVYFRQGCSEDRSTEDWLKAASRRGLIVFDQGHIAIKRLV
jgi:hypothetical protein